MIQTANEDTPHYNTQIKFIVSNVIDGRGISRLKTENLAEAVIDATLDAMICTLWGKSAVLLKIVESSVKRSTLPDGRAISISIDAPENTNRSDLISSIERRWETQFERQFDAYISFRRHYSAEEILENIW